VILDGDTLGSTKIKIASGGPQDILLASGLSAGPHRVEVVRETSQKDTGFQFLGFGGAGGSGELAPPPRPSHRIEFYGDSNLAGYSLEHEQNRYGVQYEGCTLSSMQARFDRIDRYDARPTPSWSISKARWAGHQR